MNLKNKESESMDTCYRIKCNTGTCIDNGLRNDKQCRRFRNGNGRSGRSYIDIYDYGRDNKCVGGRRRDRTDVFRTADSNMSSYFRIYAQEELDKGGRSETRYLIKNGGAL